MTSERTWYTVWSMGSWAIGLAFLISMVLFAEWLSESDPEIAFDLTIFGFIVFSTGLILGVLAMRNVGGTNLPAVAAVTLNSTNVVLGIVGLVSGWF